MVELEYYILSQVKVNFKIRKEEKVPMLPS